MTPSKILQTTALALALPLFVAGCTDTKTEFFTPKSIPEQLDVLGLTTLRTALEAADLVDDLETAGPFTLFAPSNAAFADLPAGVLDTLLQPANQAQLIDLLQYHLLVGALPSAALISMDAETTANGADLLLNVVAGSLFVNDARVTQNDVPATNGFVHVIDTILQPPQSIAATLTARGFDTLVAAAVAADLDGALAAPGSLTVLAPTDAAFAALPAGVLADLLLPGNQQDLIDLLSLHVLTSQVSTTEAVSQEQVTSLLGPEDLFSIDGMGNVFVNGVRLEMVNIPCTNGIIHSIQAVLPIPEDVPGLAVAGGFDTLVAALVAAGLDDDLASPAGPFTVFAPTDAAFAALPTGVLAALLEPANQADLIQVLTYHVIANDSLTASELAGLTTVTTLEGSDIDITSSGSGLVLNGTTQVVSANNIAFNGLVHAIDEVLLPPGFIPPSSGGGGKSLANNGQGESSGPLDALRASAPQVFGEGLLATLESSVLMQAGSAARSVSGAKGLSSLSGLTQPSNGPQPTSASLMTSNGQRVPFQWVGALSEPSLLGTLEGDLPLSLLTGAIAVEALGVDGLPVLVDLLSVEPTTAGFRLWFGGSEAFQVLSLRGWVLPAEDSPVSLELSALKTL